MKDKRIRLNDDIFIKKRDKMEIDLIKIFGKIQSKLIRRN